MRGVLHTCSSWNSFFIVGIFLLLAVNRKTGRARVVPKQCFSCDGMGSRESLTRVEEASRI